MKIKLTYKQIDLLRKYFDRVQATAVMGNPGMLVAQLEHDKRNNVYTLTPAFLPHDLAKVITERGSSEIPGPIRSSADAVTGDGA